MHPSDHTHFENICIFSKGSYFKYLQISLLYFLKERYLKEPVAAKQGRLILKITVGSVIANYPIDYCLWRGSVPYGSHKMTVCNRWDLKHANPIIFLLDGHSWGLDGPSNIQNLCQILQVLYNQPPETK